MMSLRKKIQMDRMCCRSMCCEDMCMDTVYYCLNNRQNLFFGKYTSAKGICC